MRAGKLTSTDVSLPLLNTRFAIVTNRLLMLSMWMKPSCAYTCAGIELGFRHTDHERTTGLAIYRITKHYSLGAMVLMTTNQTQNTRGWIRPLEEINPIRFLRPTQVSGRYRS